MFLNISDLLSLWSSFLKPNFYTPFFKKRGEGGGLGFILVFQKGNDFMKHIIYRLSLACSFVILAAGLVHAEGSSQWTDKFEAGYNKGFYIGSTDKKFKLKINSYLQLMYEFEHFENSSKETKNTFRVRRARLTFSGNVFSPNFTFKLQTDMIKGDILDAYVDYKFNDYFALRVGEFSMPWGRQQLVSSSRQQFLDRSLASSEFVNGYEVDSDGDGVVNSLKKDGRDIGIMGHGKAFDKKLEYQVAVMNGDGRNTLNGNKDFLYLGRAAYNIMGDYGYAESDLEFSDDPALFVGGAVNYNKRAISKSKVLQAGFETGLKFKGLSLQGEFLYRNLDDPTASKKKIDLGYYAQAGYFIIPKKFEIAARASQVFFDGPRNDKAEFSLGLNYFLWKRNVKLQSDYSWMPNNTKTGVENDHRLRLKLQTAF